MTNYIDTKQLAQHFGVSVRTIASWRNYGLPSIQFPGSRLVRFDLEAVQHWLQAQQTSQQTKTQGGGK